MREQPDWSKTLATGAGEVFLGYQQPNVGYAPPRSLTLARRSGGSSSFALEVFGFDGGDGQPEVRGLLSMSFVGDYALADRQTELWTNHPELKLLPLAPRSGFLRFEAAEVLDLPDNLCTPKPLVWTGTGALTFAAALDPQATAFARDAILAGAFPVRAVAEIEFIGIATRANVIAKFDPSQLEPLLRSLLPGGLGTRQALISGLASSELEILIDLQPTPTPADRQTIAEALADRLLARFARLSVAPNPSLGPMYAFDLEALRAGSFTWDLNEPLLAPRARVIASDAVSSLVATATTRELVHHGPTTTFRTGMHVLSLSPNLPERRSGVLMLGAEVRFPSRPPHRFHVVAASASFKQDQSVQHLGVRLAPSEPIAFRYQANAFVVEGGRARRLEGEWRDHEGAHLTIPPDAFPVSFARIEAEPSLLRTGTIQLTCRGTFGDSSWQVSETLSASEPSIAVVIPASLRNGTVAVALLGPNGERAILPELPIADLWLHSGLFPNTGPQCVTIDCAFDDTTPFVAIDCVAEERLDDATAVELVRLTPKATQRSWRWLATDPLRPGFRWRWHNPQSGSANAWSERCDPSTPLVLQSSRMPTRHTSASLEASA